MSEKERKHFPEKKKTVWISVTFLLVTGAAAVLFFCMNRQNDQPEKMIQTPAGMTFSEDVITTSGLTQVGMAALEWELDFLTEGLEVEETYLHVGDSVDAGTPIFKITQESLETAREELEFSEKEASLNLREGLISYETGKIEVQKEYDLAMVEAEYAKNTYDTALMNAQESLDAAEKQVEDAQKKVDEYTASIETNYYYTYYEVKEKQNLWYEYAELMAALYDQWKIEELEQTYGGMSDEGSSMNSKSSSGSNLTEVSAVTRQSMTGNSDEQSKYEVYTNLEEETALRKQEYEEALELYEDAKAKAQAGIEQAKSELFSLEAKLVLQQDTYEKAKLTAQAAYDLALAAKDSAQMVYEAGMDQLEEDYEDLKDKQEEAAENVKLFNEKVADGYFYTDKSGIVMMSSLKEGDILSGSSIVLAYQDISDISVSASVQQENIASVSIGQEAVIYVSGYAAMEGIVTAIDPVSGDSRGSSVAYSVTVTPVDAADGLEGNMTAYVYFGLNENEKEMMMSREKRNK